MRESIGNTYPSVPALIRMQTVIWQVEGSRYLSPPYQIIKGIRGYALWIKDAKTYRVIKSEIESLHKAKILADGHSKEFL